MGIPSHKSAFFRLMEQEEGQEDPTGPTEQNGDVDGGYNEWLDTRESDDPSAEPDEEDSPPPPETPTEQLCDFLGFEVRTRPKARLAGI